MNTLKKCGVGSKAHYYVFIVVFLCGAIISAIMYSEAKNQVAIAQTASSNVFVEKLARAVENYQSISSSVVSLIESSQSSVSPDQFTRFVQKVMPASDYFGSNVYFAQYVLSKDKPSFLQQNQSLYGYKDFSIYPLGDRDAYMPLVLAYPDKVAYGFDILSAEYRNSAQVAQSRYALTAMLSEPTSSPFFKMPGKNSANNFVLRAPVYVPVGSQTYTDDLVTGFFGLVGVHFTVEGLLKQVVPLTDKGLQYRLADVSGEQTVWFADSAVASFWGDVAFDSHYLSVAGRKWRVDTCFASSVAQRLSWWQVITPLSVFTLLAFFLFLYTRTLCLETYSVWRTLNERIEIDELTGLHTRHQIRQKLTELMLDNQGNGQKIAALILDLDHFKTINDAFGHEVGDALLAKVSERLTSILPEGTLTGYLGGDAFLIVLPENQSQRLPNLSHLCKDLISKISQSYFTDGLTLDIGCSIGVAVYPEFGSDAVHLIKNADMAVYQAKASGRATYHFYDGEMGRRFARNVRIETRLRRALEEEKLELHFQPKMDLVTERCIGMEALLRWNDGELGSVSPAEFIPIAEQTGIILPLGDWVFEQAFKHMQEWKEQGINVPPIAINCSAAQLKRVDFLSKLLALLDKYHIDASLLEIEVTESILIEDADGCAELLCQMSRLGMKLAIDDFGTGYSSLSYLKDLPFDCVKIDMVFIRDMMNNKSNAALTKAIISLSHDLGLKVVAEGISDVDQLARLREYGCDIGQGYLFSKALGPRSMVNDPMIVALNQQEESDF
ncbi:EAL domain-containing protein [Marinomonas algarum]|uniref:EAL domain-containing protein n=1 Tax=Marinomonas algarum TaxID=2883105 RepID=A0A9X1IJW6_9GAMM|nr:EAL domain-containing protein [Marinomonas algarum]MCB5160627.1 EAL domain-containing protein [Marinomonas algarum]